MKENVFKILIKETVKEENKVYRERISTLEKQEDTYTQTQTHNTDITTTTTA